MNHIPQKVFARNSTGLVRQISPTDAFLFNQSFINAGLIVLLTLIYVPAIYPGASILVAAVLGTLLALPTALVHGVLATAYPRSGGDYVYNSRILHPAVGFGGNFNITIWLLIYVGFGAYGFSQFGLVPAFRFLANAGWPGLHAVASWSGTPVGSFVVGSVLLVLVTAAYVTHTRSVTRIQRILFLIGAVSFVAMTAVMLATRPAEFAGRLDAYLAAAFQFTDGTAGIMRQATDLGYQTGKAFSAASTFLALYFVANWFFWGNASTYLGGEVQRAERTQILTMPLAVVVTGVLVFFCFLGFQRAVTADLLGSIGYGMAMAPESSPALLYSELAAVASGSKWIGGLIVLGALYWPLAFVLAPLGPTTRNVLAWSLDQLIPDRFSRLHPKTHTPVAAILLCASVAEIGLVLFSFFPAFSAMVGVVGAFLTYALTSVSAAVLPFRSRLGVGTPPLQRRLGPVPVITVIAGVSLLAIAVLDISVLSDPFSGISLSPTVDAGLGQGLPFLMFLVNIGIFSCGFVLYGLAYWIQRRRGVDVSLAFKEIPPE